MGHVDPIFDYVGDFGSEIIASNAGVLVGDREGQIGGREDCRLISSIQLPLTKDVGALAPVWLSFMMPLPDGRLDVVGHHDPGSCFAIQEVGRVRGPFALPDVDGVLLGVVFHGVRESAAAVPLDRVGDGRKEVEANLERLDEAVRGGEPSGAGAGDNDRFDAERVDVMFGWEDFISVGVGVADQGDVVARGKVADEVENADSLAGDRRVWEFLVNNDDVEAARWVGAALARLANSGCGDGHG